MPDGLAPDEPSLAQLVDGQSKGDVAAGDRRCAGAAVGLEDVAVDDDGVLAERIEVDGGAEGAADEPLDLGGATVDAATAPVALGAHLGAARQHGVLRGDPAGA